MRRAGALLMCLLIPAAVPAQQKLTKELAALQGAWVVASINGAEVPAGEPAPIVTITGNAYSVAVNETVNERGTFKIDTKKKPWAIDLSITFGESANKTQLGIVELTGDSNRIAVNTPGATERPADFTIRPGYDVIVSKRKPKA